MTLSTEKADIDIKYCVVAFIDLLGFSSHLEVSNDLRTSIGLEAINRLGALDSALELITQGLKEHAAFYPTGLFYTRVNDALIFSLDINDALRPSIGETFPLGKTVAEWEQYFDFDNIPEDEFEEEYSAKLRQWTRPVEQFVGLISKVHSFINSLESKRHFPGAKSIISSGFRRRFIVSSKEDVLSANFAFSNAYLAEQKLSGPKFYIDNNILQLLTADSVVRNVLKLSCFAYQQNVFSPFNVQDEVFGLGGHYVETEVQNLTLLRKQYFFRHVNQNPLTYLQLLDKIRSVADATDTDKRSLMAKRIIKEFLDPEIETKIREGKLVLTLRAPLTLEDDMTEFIRKVFG